MFTLFIGELISERCYVLNQWYKTKKIAGEIGAIAHDLYILSGQVISEIWRLIWSKK